MFDALTQKLEVALKRLRGQGRISEENIAETLREVRTVLLDAALANAVFKTDQRKAPKRMART